MTEPRPRTRRTKPAAPAPNGPVRGTSKPKPPPLPKPATTPKRPRARARPATPEAMAPVTAPSARTGQRRIWISGATGFVGKAVVRVLRTRGDEVIAAVRDPRKAADLVDMGVTVIEDDLSDVGLLTEELRDVDAAIHSAGSYRV